MKTKDQIVQESGALDVELVKKEDVLEQKKNIHHNYESISHGIKAINQASKELSDVIAALGEKDVWETEGGVVTRSQLSKIDDEIASYVRYINTSFGIIEKNDNITSEVKDVSEYKKIVEAPNSPVIEKNIIIPNGGEG